MVAVPLLVFGRVSNMRMRALELSVAALLLNSCNVAPTMRLSESTSPVRIVSMNPCVDGILEAIADPKHIAAVSHYSHDPRSTSVSLSWAQQFRSVSDAAEDVIAAQPDLVIAGPHVAIQALAALDRLGIPVMRTAVPTTVEQSKAQITEIAIRIGRRDTGQKLNAQIDNALVNAKSELPPIKALIWQGSGLVPGKGTLADEVLTRAGFENISSGIGLKQWDILPIERMIFAPPKVLLSGTANMGESEGEANRMLTHPALTKARDQIKIVNYPARFLNCGGPTIIKSAARLTEIRKSLENSR
jgi:iron complex transport system substrate-binding protein